MSDILISTELTAYNVDGLELFFTASRKVRASQSAIARMCGVTETTVRNDLKTLEANGTILDVVYSQGRSATRESRSKLHGSHTIKVLLKKRNPDLLEQFLEFGIDEGLAQMAGVPLPTVTPVPNGFVMPSNVAILEIALQLAKEDANRQQFHQDKPGLKALDDLAKSDKTLALPAGNFIVRELAAELGLTLTKPQSCGLSGMLTNAVMAQTQQLPARRYITDGKRKQGYWVNEYSYDFKSVAMDCSKHMSII